MDKPLITVFGGTGFLGRRIVRHLLVREARVRVATRHPARVGEMFADCTEPPEGVDADIHNEQAIRSALDGANGAVNAVSLYVETARTTFQDVHVEGAGRLARCAREAGIERFVHISGIGSDPDSDSSYIRSRGRGEEVVRTMLPSVTILRPAVMFGPDDSFLSRLIAITGRAPVIPLFGKGEMQVEPAYVHDVAEAAARVLTDPEDHAPVYELGGPERFRYRELLETLARKQDRRPYLMPMPMTVWLALGWAGEMLPGAPLTRNQIELMREDNVASPGTPGFGALNIEPHTIDAIVEAKKAA